MTSSSQLAELPEQILVLPETQDMHHEPLRAWMAARDPSYLYMVAGPERRRCRKAGPTLTSSVIDGN